MSFPEPVQFAWTDQSATDSVLVEQLGEPLRQLHSLAENDPRRLGRTSGQDIHPAVSRETKDFASSLPDRDPKPRTNPLFHVKPRRTSTGEAKDHSARPEFQNGCTTTTAQSGTWQTG
jgi:hypothetical protein